MICKHVHYSGHVQGVGFRYTTRQVASGFVVSGWVRNRRDGTVELVVEGQAEEVDAFLAALAERMTGYIRTTQISDKPASGLKGFEIRH